MSRHNFFFPSCSADGATGKEIDIIWKDVCLIDYMQERHLFQKYYRTATSHSKYLLHNLNKDPVLAFYLINLMLNEAHNVFLA